ncbi:hypothetical protein BDW59DRAFT_159703 [Aspergillus cavernicola]|uniref:AAA+ ATPase domain-containing protein n=1 Tax=Aspergillus cavernicola TaxID=176166 RepID=A0ABR4IL45_9EURO
MLSTIDLQHGYILLLIVFTLEDKAAKGLRKRTALDKPEPAVYFSALEVVRDNRVLLLTGPSGSGKTNFAKYLYWGLTLFPGRGRDVIRNELGFIYEERWDGANVLPCYFAVEGTGALRALVEDTIPSLLEYSTSQDIEERQELLIVLDEREKARDDSPALLEKLISLIEGLANIRLLVLSDVSSGSLDIAAGAAAANPAILALALQARHSGIRLRMFCCCSGHKGPNKLAYEAFQRISHHERPDIQDPDTLSSLQNQQTLFLSSADTVQRLLAARHLSTLSTDAAIHFYPSNRLEAEPVIHSLLRFSTSNNSHILAKAVLVRIRPTRHLTSLHLKPRINPPQQSNSHPHAQNDRHSHAQHQLQPKGWLPRRYFFSSAPGAHGFHARIYLTYQCILLRGVAATRTILVLAQQTLSVEHVAFLLLRAAQVHCDSMLSFNLLD